MISKFRMSTPFLPSSPLPHLDKTSGSICSCGFIGESLISHSDFSKVASLSSLKMYDSRGSAKDRCPVSLEIKDILDVRGSKTIRIPGGTGPRRAVPST